MSVETVFVVELIAIPCIAVVGFYFSFHTTRQEKRIKRLELAIKEERLKMDLASMRNDSINKLLKL